MAEQLARGPRRALSHTIDFETRTLGSGQTTALDGERKQCVSILLDFPEYRCD